MDSLDGWIEEAMTAWKSSRPLLSLAIGCSRCEERLLSVAATATCSAASERVDTEDPQCRILPLSSSRFKLGVVDGGAARLPCRTP